MSFLKLKELLVGAFQRIDHTSHLKEKKEEDIVLGILKKHIPTIDAEVKHGAIIVYSHSPILSQKIRIRENIILADIQRTNPEIIIQRILFKGPRS
ncbi:MAG TPA: hypothetical protein VJB56_01375 [Candidatus Paceibacterota bacterium]|uniref:DUF721 domain-containing protein n=1 Tax=Candidatus Giovannonibacteria bacterium RIFCSPLOWO2_01_FULL_46_32 TaxID=1798353 RepID=A0A1F5XFD1_9BACT|nr:MAG: hypothetical protein A3B19_00435 [Candidatus Giovannonibacteria bacterium RIFCSPLOWO2_01_FULL_46_32]